MNDVIDLLDSATTAPAVPPRPASKEEAVAALYRQHISAAVGVAHLILRDRHAAEDAAQDAFLKAAAKVGDLRDADRFRPYLMKATVRQALMLRRGQERDLRRAVTVDRQTTTRTAVDEAADSGLRLDIADALRQLPQRQQSVLILKYWADLSERDIATALGIRPGTVKSTASRALRALEESLHDHQH